MIFLIDWRKRAGKTQKDVAEALGVSQSAVSQWESGAVQIPLSQLSALARWLLVSPEQLGAALLAWPKIIPPTLADRLAALEDHQVSGLVIPAPAGQEPAPAGQEPAPAGQELLFYTSALLDHLELIAAAGQVLDRRDLEQLSENISRLRGL